MGDQNEYDNTSSAMQTLLDTMRRLRAPGGCPWDQKQTHTTLRRYAIEEAYELVDAIETGDDAALIEELGDVLLQVVFHATIAAEQNRFTMEDVIAGLQRKLLRRHPHVFGDASAADADEVEQTWAAVKRREARTQTEKHASLLSSVPRQFPALMEAEKVQARAAEVGFQWDDVGGAWEKLSEELAELREAQTKATAASTQRIRAAAKEAVREEFGDVLFALVNIARYLDVDAEQSLRDSTTKFRRRFDYIEGAARAEGRQPTEMTLAEMDALWDEAKRNE